MVFKIDTSIFQKFFILLYKGYLLRKRHYIITVFEIVFPVLVASIPAIILSETNSPIRDASSKGFKWMNDTFYPAYDPFITGGDAWYDKSFALAYAPGNDVTDKLVNKSIAIWEKSHPDHEKVRIERFENGDEVENYCMAVKQEKGPLQPIGILFNNMKAIENLPSDLDYTIRYPSSEFQTKLKYRFSSRYNSDPYKKTFFLSWQAAIEKAFIQSQTKMEEEQKASFDYKLWMQQLPYPKHRELDNKMNVAAFIPMMIINGLIVYIINIVRRVIEEKSNGSKELLKMMGMTDFIYWFSTFLNYFVIGIFIISIITIIYKSPLKDSVVLLKHSDGFLIFILFLLFIASLTLFCLAFTTFFNKTIFGIIVMLIILNFGYSLLAQFVFPMFGGIEESYYSLSVPVKFLICLFPFGALLSMMELIIPFENSAEGVQWSNLYSYDAVPDFNVSTVMLAMLCSCFLYCLIIWYVDAVWPWQYGVAKPFYFPFTKSYWCGYKPTKVDEILLDSLNEDANRDFFEFDPTGISPGVVINNLSKVFRTGLQSKVAVKNVSLNIYNGQITALLGHNGAGKTTTINILTGLFSPSGGTASINGFDVFSQLTEARRSLGVCPQHNVLYDTLTVEEHLKIYAALKGVKWNDINKEIDSILTMLHLVGKKSELAKTLSGGMKRKLSLGIAVIGGSKVLILDEPTSGMDVQARRAVWDTLLDIRNDRTVILTTHYMEEADILGDRIAIMAEGEIQCCGSSLFLKKKFGTGYHLHIVKRQNFDMNAVKAVLGNFVPGATLESNHEGEATFNLLSDSHSNFGSLFKEIETRKDILGINSCGVTVTTMEDVFLNVSNLADKKIQEKFSIENAEETEMKDIYIEANNFKRTQKLGNQFLGLVMKRLHYAKRHWSVLISQIALPFLIMCLCLSAINNASPNSGSEPSLKMDIMEVYGETDSFYYSDDAAASNLFAEEFKKTLQKKNVNIESVDEPETFAIDYGAKKMSNYYKRLVVGGNIEWPDDSFNLTAWFNGFPYHSQPMSLLLMHTALLRKVSGSGSITLTNDPLPSVDNYFLFDDSHSSEKVLASVFVPLALSFVTSSFILIPIHEKTSKAKLLQMMSGISPATYWLSMFVWDFAISVIVNLFLIIPFAIFSHYAFFASHSEAIGTAILILFFYGWSSIPFSYLLSLVFKKPNTGFAVVNVICIITGVAVGSILTSLTISKEIKENIGVKAFAWIMKIFPMYALSEGFSNLFAVTYSNAFCESLDPKYIKYSCTGNATLRYSFVLKCCKDEFGKTSVNQTNPLTLDRDACGRDILFLFIDGIIFFLLLLLFESSFMKMAVRHASQRISSRKVAANQFVNAGFVEDSDVLQEEERVRNHHEQLSHNEALVALDLTKQFKSIKAVDRLTFGIHKKECFGLLGVNGAGKTTTFRMLTGDCYPSDGNAFTGNSSIINHLKEFQSYLGYCPQFDALIDRLSAREMITLFARLRGLSGPSMTRYVNALIKMTDLTQYADKPSMVYSGGNKRKLSIALALIGAPPLLLLDEPTAGVDPVSRRKIWKILSLARIYSGAAVILTTHSMEESEALCSRLAIMVNGRFRCLGSIQHLKTKYGQGYTLIIKMKKEEQNIIQSMNAAKAYIDTNLPGANLKDDHQGMLQYHVVDPSVTLSHLFRFMDDMKNICNLEDYVISDTSLEQIFLAFARSQRVVAS